MASAESDSTPWHDEETLRRLYWVEEMTTEEISEKFGCSQPNIFYWMDKFDIDRRRNGPR